MLDPKKVIKYFILIIILISYSSMGYSQELEWVFLPENDINTSCTSTSSVQDSTACFGLVYFPSTAGTVTSYTLGYFIDCNQGNNAILSGQSCVMTDNTTILEDCSGLGLSLLLASGQDGSLAVNAGDSVILHQVCLEIGIGDSLTVALDDFTGISIGLETPAGPITDFPSTPSSIELIDSVFAIVPCDVTNKVCSFNFGSNETRNAFEINGNGNILDAASDTLLQDNLVLNIYDEINEICQEPGGLDDVSISLELLTTQDQYGNAIIDDLAGETHRIAQATDGLLIELPFNVDTLSESSSSDVRGISFKVDFALHIGIFAEQFSVDLSDVNSSGEIYESAAVIFYNEFDIPYDTIMYEGFYDVSSDLSGQCNQNSLGDAWVSLGDSIGSFFLDSLNRVEIVDPCNPTAGVSTNDTISVHAVQDAGPVSYTHLTLPTILLV